MKKLLLKSLLFLTVFLLINSQGIAQDNNKQLKPIVKKAAWFRVSPPLTEMIKNAEAVRTEKEVEREVENELEFHPKDTKQNVKDVLSSLQRNYNLNIKGETLTELADFDGVDNVDGVAPPDTHGDVNENYYMQCTNGHSVIKNKSGTTVQGPFPTSDFWQGSGYDDLNNGDAVILWDEDAQRWFVTQFYLPSSGDQYLLIAVSQTADPTGSYYQYAFPYTYMPDYPKWAVWPDAYYVGANAFDQNNNYAYKGVYVTAFERSKMITGDPNANSVTFGPNASLWSVFPADADVFPSTGTSCPFMSDQVDYTSGNNEVYIYDFHVDWNNTGNSTFGLSQTLTVSDYSMFNSDGAQVPQPGVSQKLDLLHSRIMYRPYYRHFSDHESLLMTRTVKDGSVAAVRWYEFRNTGASWSLYQEGTYNPGDGLWRWMPSIAMNENGDIAIGYSVSDGSSKYPSIRCVARYDNDPLGVMSTNEAEFFTGSASQDGVSRWGDYSMMSVDPSDNTSFWFTTEYSSGGWDWKTRITHFELPVQCTGPSTQASDFSATSIGDNQMTVNWIRGNGDRIIVVAHEGSAVDANPSNGISYTANSVFGSGNEIGTGNFVVYDGTGNNVTVTGLTAGTQYYYAIYEYFTADDCYNTTALTGNATTTGIAPCTPCTVSSTTDDDTGVTNLTFNSINSNSTGTPEYTDFTSLSTDVTIGSSYDLSVNVNTAGSYTVYTKVWIDWNHNCDFSDAGEEYDLGTANNVTDGATSNSPLTISIPAGATIGNTTLRVRTTYNTTPVSCGNQNYSEAEDYTINVIDPNSPNITVTESNLDFGKVGVGYSSIRTYDVSGTNLTNDITVAGTSDFQVSTDGTNFSNSAIVPQSGGNASATITVKFEPAAVQTYSGTITNVSSGATQKNVICNGEGVQWFFPPTNLSGSFATGTNDVNLTWNAPNTSNSSTNWYEYAATADCGSYSSSDYTTRVVYFTSDELAYTYPIKITQLRTGFYDNGAWTNTQFKFVIYAEDLTTKLYETAVLNADQNGNVSTYSYTLPEAVTITGNFYVGVETVSSDGSPFNLLKQQADNNYHTYVYDGTDWYYYSDGTNAYDLPQGVYIDGGKGGKWLNSSVNLSSVNIKPINTGIARIINNQPKSMLTGYRVYRDGTQIGSDLSVATTAYTDNSVCGTYNYSVTALYSGYDGESDAVQTSMTYNSPVITSQPNSSEVCEGDNATFNVTATGNDLSYQWKKDGSNISGANSDTYTISEVTTGDAGNYTCDITNVCGSVSSDVATLTVSPAPVPPTSVTATLTNQCAGVSNQLSYTGGSGDTFKWYTGSCGGTEIGTGNNLLISPSFTTTYYGRWEKACGVSACESVTVTITDATAVTTQPQSQAVCEDGNVTFTVTATGSNLTYQWQKDGSDISGATSDSYTLSNVSSSDEGNYTCDVTGDCGIVTSDAAVLTINPATVITTQPVSVNANMGDDVTFSVVAEGSNLSYQWQFNNSDIIGETADSYTITNVQVSNAGNYDVVVSGDCGNLTSDIAVLTVASSVEDLAAFGINIYPNPSDGTFRIEIKNKEKTADVSISDMTGKIIYSNKLNTSENYAIKLNDVSKGVYFMKINLGDKSVVSKLIIQ